MKFSDVLKTGLIVLSGIALAFFAGYILFSYFNKDSGEAENTELTSTPQSFESDTEGIYPTSEGSVAGASTTATSDSSGISSSGATTTTTTAPTSTTSTTTTSTTSTTTSTDGIAPNGQPAQVNTITEEDVQEYEDSQDSDSNDDVTYETADDGNDDSEITNSENPEVNDEDGYFEYVYKFDFNDDAQDRYKDGFSYKINAHSCDESKFFTSSSYDFSGTISSDDIDDEVTIKVRIKDDYIDDSNDFDDSEYHFDGKNYTVEGDVNVPQCD
jgi:hypothetical protein